MGGNEARVYLVLMQLLLSYANHVVLMLTSIFISIISIRKQKRFVLRNGPDKNDSNNGNEHVGMQKSC